MKKEKILIAEDDEGVAEVVKRMVRALQYEVVAVVGSGEEAVESALRHRPDLILMDIKLEGNIDGTEAAVLIKKKYDVPIIFATALSDNASIINAMKSEPYGYIIKPFELHDLRAAIEVSLFKNRAEQKLKESELWLKSSFNSIDQGILTTDRNGLINYLNPAAENILGLSLEECSGKDYLEVYRVADIISDESLIYSIQNPNYNPQTSLLNKFLITKNDLQIPIEETIADIRDDKDNLLGKVIAFKDVSKMRESQLAILSARNFYISLLEDFPVLVWRANSQGYFNYFNKTWLAFTGRNLEQDIYYGWIERIHEEDKDIFSNLFRSSFKRKERFECEFRLLNCEGNYSWILAVGTPFYDLNKNFAGYIFAGLDLTKKKILERELRREMINAEAASRAKSNFISNMSHEIRTPLNGIVGLTELLLETELNQEQSEYLEMVRQSSEVLMNLLNNLLSQSKLEAGKEFIKETEFTLQEMVDEVWNPFAAQAQLKNLTAEKIIGFNASRKVIGDKVKIQQILLNLLTNALKFTEKGKIELQLINENELSAGSPDRELMHLHIVVKDTGIGIPSDQHERIFESFTQVDSSSTKKYAGVGLGLCIVKSLVKLFDGKIWFESKEGAGTEFHVLLVLNCIPECAVREIIMTDK